MGLCGGVGVVVVPHDVRMASGGSRWAQAWSGQRCWRGRVLGCNAAATESATGPFGHLVRKGPLITCALQRYNDN